MEIEKQLKKLEEIVEKIENDKTSIDEAIKMFEEGVSIIKNTQGQINDAVGKITILKKDLDSLSEQKFSTLDD